MTLLFYTYYAADATFTPLSTNELAMVIMKKENEEKREMSR